MSDPLRDAERRMFEAVAACTRALAGSRAADLPSSTSRVSSLAALRAAGDRAAVRRRFHDPATHDANRPRAVAAAALFDAFEEARLDVLGAQWMPGVAVNLMGHPGPEPSAVRSVVVQMLSGRAVPAALAGEAARLRRDLPPGLLDGLLDLRTMLGDQSSFGRASADCAMAAAARGWGRRMPKGPEKSDAKPPARRPHSTGADPTRTGDQTDSAAYLRFRPEEGVSRGRPTGPGPSAGAWEVGVTGYTAYTTAYDRIVDAASMVGPAELARLRARLDRELGETRLAVTRLANRLRRLLLARQARHWQFDLDEGWVDGRRLAGVVAGSGEVWPFKQETDSPFPAAAVSLLIDHSGSMRGRPILMAALTVEILVQALERCGVGCEVLGFTTQEWDGGRPAREWTAAARPANPGRLNALEHIILKAAEVPWRRARAGLGIALHDELLRENIDGEAVIWAHARLRRRPERRRLLLVVSDGAPRDEATERANGAGYLPRHLRAVVEEIEARSPVRIAAIGMGHDVSRFYARATTITRVEDLGAAVSQALVSFLAPDPPAPARPWCM